MTSAGSRAFSSRSPPRGRYYSSQSAPATATNMTPPPRQFYSPPPGYYRPFVYPTTMAHPTATQYGPSPTKQPQQHRGRGKYEGAPQVMLADSTTGSPQSLTMKKSPLQVSVRVKYNVIMVKMAVQ